MGEQKKKGESASTSIFLSISRDSHLPFPPFLTMAKKGNLFGIYLWHFQWDKSFSCFLLATVKPLILCRFDSAPPATFKRRMRVLNPATRSFKPLSDNLTFAFAENFKLWSRLIDVRMPGSAFDLRQGLPAEQSQHNSKKLWRWKVFGVRTKWLDVMFNIIAQGQRADVVFFN